MANPQINDSALMVQRYILGLMTPDEEVSFEHAVTKNPELRDELAGTNETMTLLYEDLSKNTPRPRKVLRDMILAKATGAQSPDSKYNVDEFVLLAKDMKWANTNVEGIDFKVLFTDDDGRTMLIARFEPGAVFPPHKRLGTEECYVLSGDFWADGQKLTAGDFIAGRDEEETEPLYSEGGCELLLKLTIPSEIQAN